MTAPPTPESLQRLADYLQSMVRIYEGYGRPGFMLANEDAERIIAALRKQDQGEDEARLEQRLDRTYRDGARRGFQLGFDGDEEGLQRLVAARTQPLSAYKDLGSSQEQSDRRFCGKGPSGEAVEAALTRIRQGYVEWWLPFNGPRAFGEAVTAILALAPEPRQEAGELEAKIAHLEKVLSEREAQYTTEIALSQKYIALSTTIQADRDRMEGALRFYSPHGGAWEWEAYGDDDGQGGQCIGGYDAMPSKALLRDQGKQAASALPAPDRGVGG